MAQEDVATCAVCGREGVRPFAELRGVPINCTTLHRERDEARAVPRGDIVLGHCAACGLIRNLAFDPGRVAYDLDYENSQHFSPAFERFARTLASDLIERHGVRGRDVVEIGSGKGDFLRLLCSLGDNRGVGFDPTGEDGADPGVGGGIRFVRAFYDESQAEVPADLVCCRHVLEHLADPRGVVAGLRRTLAARPSAVLYFEVPDAEKVLTDEGMWDIIYPHCSYFAAPALRHLFASQGFRVLRVDRVFGDQFLCLEATPGAGPSAPAPQGELERLQDQVESFEVLFRDYLDRSAQRLAQARARGRRLGLWGVGAKAVTFLNLVEGADAIESLVDLNPRKQGTFVPGTGQRILGPEELAGRALDELLIMNPMYQHEIAKRLAELGVRAEISVV